MTEKVGGGEYEVFTPGDVVLQSGEVLYDALLAYTVHGMLNERGDNMIVFPTCYAGKHEDNEWLIGQGKSLDTAHWCVVVPDMLGNGLSSSPSNSAPSQSGPAFPRITIADNIALQHRLVVDHLGARRIPLVVGFSMGGQQAYQWAVSYPDVVERIVVLCGSARTAPHNKVFLQGVAAALKADAAWQGGRYAAPPEVGLRALGRVWAGWGLSQQWYREHLYREQGFATMEEFIVANYEKSFLEWDANDLLAMASTWLHADVSAGPPFDGDLARALASIKAQTLIMPGSTDLYFPVADSIEEMKHLRHGELRPIPSAWGHAAGAGPNPTDAAFVAAAVAEWLARDAAL